MKILIVANYNSKHFSPFVVDQGNALKALGYNIEYHGIVGKGIWGYLKNLPVIKKKIQKFNPDIVHAHYGLSGLLANLQRKVPVVTTFHGSDIHTMGKNLFLSRVAMYLSAFNIFVSDGLFKIANYKKTNYLITSCGVNLSVFTQFDKKKAREILNLDINCKYILFSGSFDNNIKNAILAQKAVSMIDNSVLIELKGYTREQVSLLLNACNVQLTTSIRESGPLIIKEAMACGIPIVSVDVGDVKEVIASTKGCYIAEREPEDIANKLNLAFAFNGRTNGRQRIIDLGISNEQVAKQIMNIYKQIINARK